MKSIISLLFIAQLLVSTTSSFLKVKKQETTTTSGTASTTATTPPDAQTTSSNQSPSTNQPTSTTPATTTESAATIPAPTNPVITTTNSVPQAITGDEKPLKDAFCFINTNGTVYDLNSLKNNEADYKLTTETGIIDFNICRNALNPCANKAGMVSYVTNVLGENCVQIAGNATVSSQFYLITDVLRNVSVLRSVLPEGEVCASDPSKHHQTTVDFTCDETAETPVVSKSAFNINSCTHKLFVTTKAACAKYNVYAMWNQVQENKWVFGAIIMGLGVFFCFFGENFLKIAQVIAGGALVLIVFMYLIFTYTQVMLYSWQFWLIILIAGGLGCVAGWFMSKVTWLPGLVFGALLGFVLGFFMFNLCLRFIESNPAVVFWVNISICVLIGCLVGFFFEEEIAIVSTSIVGAYAIIRGLSIWCGGFPDERQVYELGSKGEWNQMKAMLSASVYGYLAGFVVLAAAGMYIQFKFFYDGSKKKKDGKNKEEGDEPLNQNQ